MVPVLKSKTAGITSSSNYCFIILSSIFAKLFDRIILIRYADLIDTSHLQFGFKKKHSTTMCSFVLNESINYYNLNRGTVYCVMLDASKAFDRVQYCKLFRKLISRKLLAVIFRFLLNMYTHHRTHGLWNGRVSHWFNVSKVV